jgi:hypothetical protein
MAIVETEIEGQRVYIDTETGQPAQAPVNTYGGSVQYQPTSYQGVEGQTLSGNAAGMIAGYPASSYLQRPSTTGKYAPEVFNPATGQFEEGYRVPFEIAGMLPMLPKSVAMGMGGTPITAPPPDSFMDKLGSAMPLLIGGFAGAAAGGLGAAGGANNNALNVALTEGYNSGTAIGASGAGTQFAGATPAAEAGAMGAGIDTAALNLASAPTNAAIDAVGAAGAGAAASGLPSWMNAIKPYTGLIGGALSAGGALLGAGQISSATRDAADLSSGAAARSTALQERMFEQNQANQAPYLAAGRNALGRITTGMAPGGEFSKSFSMDDFTADPGYGFRMSEGLKAMDRNAAARGGLISGAALKAGTRYGQDMASQEYTNAFNRYQTNRANQLQPLQSLAGIGQTTANNLANVGSNYASNVGNIDTNATNTRANAGLTAAQGYTSAYGAVGNALNNALNPNPVMAYLQSLKGVA